MELLLRNPSVLDTTITKHYFASQQQIMQSRESPNLVLFFESFEPYFKYFRLIDNILQFANKSINTKHGIQKYIDHFDIETSATAVFSTICKPDPSIIVVVV